MKGSLRTTGFPVSVRVMKEPQSGKKAYETWITQEEKLAGESAWHSDADIGYAENRIFASPKRLSKLLDEAGLLEGSEKKEHSTQDYESILKEIENMKVHDLKLSWPNEYKEAIERGDLGFLHAGSPELKWFLLTKGVVRDANGALKRLLAEDMAVLTVNFTVRNSSTNQQIYMEDVFWLVDSDDALISKLVSTNNSGWVIKPGASADFSLSTSIPNTGAKEAKPTFIVNILRGIRWKVPPVPVFRAEEKPWWKFW